MFLSKRYRMWLHYRSSKRKNGHYLIGNMLDHLNLRYIEMYSAIAQLNAFWDDLVTETFANMCTVLQFSVSLMGFCRAGKVKLAQSRCLIIIFKIPNKYIVSLLSLKIALSKSNIRWERAFQHIFSTSISVKEPSLVTQLDACCEKLCALNVKA